MLEQKPSLSRKHTLVIKGNSYEVEYPNTGKAIDIELLKLQIAGSNYDALRFGASKMAQEQADKVDMIAVFNVLIPQLREDLNSKTLFDLSEEQSNELVEVYKTQFLPWFTPIKEAIRNPKSISKNEK